MQVAGKSGAGRGYLRVFLFVLLPHVTCAGTLCLISPWYFGVSDGTRGTIRDCSTSDPTPPRHSTRPSDSFVSMLCHQGYTEETLLLTTRDRGSSKKYDKFSATPSRFSVPLVTIFHNLARLMVFEAINCNSSFPFTKREPRK